MPRKLLTSIQVHSRGSVMLALVVTVAVLAFLMNGTHLSFTTPTIQEYSGGVPILDMRMGYIPEEAYELFAALGEEGRTAYRILHLLPDVLFPIAYSLLFALMSAWFLVRLLPQDHRLQWLSLTPLVAGLADLLENLSLVVASLAYPSQMNGLVHAASLCTTVKFGLMPVGVLLLCAMLLAWFVRGRPGRQDEVIDQSDVAA